MQYERQSHRLRAAYDAIVNEIAGGKRNWAAFAQYPSVLVHDCGCKPVFQDKFGPMNMKEMWKDS